MRWFFIELDRKEQRIQIIETIFQKDNCSRTIENTVQKFFESILCFRNLKTIYSVVGTESTDTLVIEPIYRVLIKWVQWIEQISLWLTIREIFFILFELRRWKEGPFIAYHIGNMGKRFLVNFFLRFIYSYMKSMNEKSIKLYRIYSYDPETK